MEVVGLVPAAGRARRVAPLPCSKELFPVGFQAGRDGGGPRPKAAAQHLLEKMAAAGVRRGFVILRPGKWDIPAYFGDGGPVGMDLAYLVAGRSHGVPFTLDRAYPFVRDALVVLGFPDILFEPRDAFAGLLRRREATGADLVLGVFRARNPEKMDMVELDPEGRILRIEIKPSATSLVHAWLIAAWTPTFTEHLHGFVRRSAPAVEAAGGTWRGREMFVGDVVADALERGLRVETVDFGSAPYVDIGTPEDLAAAVQDFAGAPYDSGPGDGA